MTWHLLISWPHHYTVPSTHEYREITPEEFRRLTKNLDVYHQYGEIVIGESLHRLIMSRLTGLKVSGPLFDEPDGLYEYGKLPPLGAEDSVLVFYGKSEGMYIGIKYAQATQFEFNNMVVTGIIEPAGKKQSGTDVLAAADEFKAIKSRVQKAREILDSSSGSSEQQQPQEKEVLQEFEREQKAILDRLHAQPKDLEVILEKHQKEIESLQAEKRKLELKLQIERGVNEEGDDYEQRRLASRIKGVDATIKYEEEVIGAVKGLLEAITAPEGQRA